jgi:Na+/H+ antiporter NhaD/arsenite permease-like protein
VWRGGLAFLVTYLLVAGMRLRAIPMDRAAAALVGAVFAVGLGAIAPAEALGAVDLHTIVLLFAVMGMGAFVSADGFFDRAAPALSRWARTPARLLGLLVWGSGIAAAFVTNDAICVLVAPVVVAWIARWRLPRLPFLLALATASNTGSVATLVGNPQNMLCAHLGQLSFRTYAWHLLPVTIASLAANHAVLWFAFRRELEAPLPLEPASGERVATPRTWLTFGVVAATVALYTAGTDLAITSVAGFVTLMLLHRQDPSRLWERIDWSILVFFGALFVAVEAFVKSGIPALAFERFPLFSGTGPVAWVRTSFAFLVGSNVLTNVPFILVVREPMAVLPDRTLGWELLAMASTFAGNLTLTGSVANVIVAEKSRSVGGLGFWEHLRVGAPIALVTTAIGTAWLLWLRR